LEDDEAAADLVRTTPGSSSPSALAAAHLGLEEGYPSAARGYTLRKMRRMGPLAALSEEAQSNLLAGTLYEYGGASSSTVYRRQTILSAAPVPLFSDPVAMARLATSPEGQRECASRSGPPVDELASNRPAVDIALVPQDQAQAAVSTNIAAAAGDMRQLPPDAPDTGPAGGNTDSVAASVPNLLRLRLDQILRGGQQNSSRQGSHQDASMWERESWNSMLLLMDTARSVRTVCSSAFVTHRSSVAAEADGQVPLDGVERRGVGLPTQAASQALEVHSRHDVDTTVRLDEDLVDNDGSVSVGSASRSQDLVDNDRVVSVWSVSRSQDEEDEGVVSVFGFDTPRSVASQSNASVASVQVQTAGASSNSAHSVRMVLGDALAQEGGPDDGLSSVLQRLVMENLSLDDTLARSVRRVIQLGTVLTGQRLSDEEIHALPKVRFEAAEQQNCTICLEAYRSGELLTSLRCQHFFHVDCLTRWFQRSTQCPLCRMCQEH